MQVQTKKLPKSVVELTIELTQDDFRPFLERAGARLCQRKPIPGFRPGKASLDIVIKNFGEMPVWEEASVEAVEKTFSQTIFEQKLATVGSPKIDVIKLAPGNPFVYKAAVSLLPEVSLGSFASFEIKNKPTIIEDKNVEKTLEDLRKMQTKETVSTEPLKNTGKAVVDMDISLDSVPLDGGQTKNHAIYLNEEYYLPGLKEKIWGIKKGETKEFKLAFPKEHFQKNLAGKEVDFKVTATEIFELQPPEINDVFAQSLGQKDLTELKNIIRENLEGEAKMKDEEKNEIELLEKAANLTKFGDIPELLINEETHKMLHELQDGLTRQGINFEEYLNKMNKKAEDLRLDFASQAVKRIKTALMLRQIILDQKLEITDKELDEEVAKAAAPYKDDPKTLESVHSPETRNWLANSLLNKKAIDWLKTKTKMVL